MWLMTFTDIPNLNATAKDVSTLWWAYCGDLVTQELGAYPQRWVCGVGRGA